MTFRKHVLAQKNIFVNIVFRNLMDRDSVLDLKKSWLKERRLHFSYWLWHVFCLVSQKRFILERYNSYKKMFLDIPLFSMIHSCFPLKKCKPFLPHIIDFLLFYKQYRGWTYVTHVWWFFVYHPRKTVTILFTHDAMQTWLKDKIACPLGNINKIVKSGIRSTKNRSTCSFLKRNVFISF